MQKRRIALLAVLAFALALTAESSRILEDGFSVSGRKLQQEGNVINTANARCPDGCWRPGFDQDGQPASSPSGQTKDFCQEDSTKAGLYCTSCYGSLIVRLTDGKCGCPRGKYSTGNTTDPNVYKCQDCPKNSYCSGGAFTITSPFTSTGIQDCPNSMVTIGKRTETSRGCVNKPGYYYTIDPVTGPNQVVCPENTYGPGLKKQRACVPCPTGFTTKGATQQTRPDQCIVPAGYYLKSPGQAAPCPMGEWKSGEGPSGNCTKCAFGVTTLTEGSTSESNCTQVVPGRYATSLAADGTVLATQICPQKYYCPGGDPKKAYVTTTEFANINNTAGEETTIYPCPEGTWTQDLGATDADQCLTPPGFRTFNGNTTQCDAGYYRANWKPRNQATNCDWCGQGVFADTTDRLKEYNLTDPTSFRFISITSTSDDCYILPGQGLYYSTITGSWRARNCDSDTYGTANRTYGLTPAPCRDCPAGMTAVNNGTTYPNSTKYFYDNPGVTGVSGFISPLACVTKAGYGYNGRIAQQCDVGTYNAADTRSTCTSCGYGFTTDAPGAGITQADCGPAAGFGYYNMSGVYALVPCPIGTYNNISWNSNDTATCMACPNGTTTQREGSTSPADCNVCASGFGGLACATQCGGGSGSLANYGLAGSPLDTPCKNCSFSGTGFSFEYNLTNLVYAPKGVARLGANSSRDCLTEFTQIVDKAWYIPEITSGTGFNATSFSKTTQPTLEACLATCNTDTCQYVTYDYDATTNNCLTNEPQVAGAAALVGDGFIAWKAGPSGDLATSSLAQSVAANSDGAKIKGQAVASGFYSWFKDSAAQLYGTQVAASTMNTTALATTQDCLNLCDEDWKCAGVSFKRQVTAGATSANCNLVYGNSQIGSFKRTMLRTAVTKLLRPTDADFGNTANSGMADRR